MSREIQTHTKCWSRRFASLVVSVGRCGENVWGINILHAVLIRVSQLESGAV
jgi:hypothetical protein